MTSPSFKFRLGEVLEGIQSQVSIIADIIAEIGSMTRELVIEVRALRRELSKEKNDQ